MTTTAESSKASAPGLTPAQLKHFMEQGFLVLEDLIDAGEVAALLGRLSEYAEKKRPVPEGLEMQVEPRVERGEMSAPNALARYRKIAGLVPRDDRFTALAKNPKLVAAMQSLMGPNLKLFRDAALMKPPGVGSAKGMHQDSPYWPIEPYELASCWIALDPATRSNGCMTVIPGSHREPAKPHVHVTDDFVIPEEHYDVSKTLPVEMKPGSGLVFHSLLIHGTAPNTSPNPRRAIVLSYMSADYRYTGPQPKPTYVRIAGTDMPGGV